MKCNFLEDYPSKEDLLSGAHTRIAEAINSLIDNNDTTKRIIGIEGDWGSGKSTIVNLLSIKHNRKVFVFDAWSHQGDPLRRIFLERFIADIKNNIKLKKKDNELLDNIIKLVSKKEKRITRTKSRHFTFTGLLLTAFALGMPAAIASLNYFEKYNLNKWMALPIMVLLGPLFILLSNILYNKLFKGDHDILNTINISIFNNTSDDTIEDEVHREDGQTSVEFEKYFSSILSHLNSSTYLLVVDNIDRVDPGEARSIWNNMQLFIDVIKRSKSINVWIIVPFAQDGIEQLWSSNASNGTNVATRFINKTFDIIFYVPTLLLSDWSKYFKQLLMYAYGDISDSLIDDIYLVLSSTSNYNVDPPTPRVLISLINNATSYIISHNINDDIDIVILYNYVLLKKYNDRDIIQILVDRTISKPTVVNADDDYYYNVIAALEYGVDKERAKSLLTNRMMYSYYNNKDKVNIIGIIRDSTKNDIVLDWMQRYAEKIVQEKDTQKMINMVSLNMDSDVIKAAIDNNKAVLDITYRLIMNHRFGIEVLYDNIDWIVDSMLYYEDFALVNSIVNKVYNSSEFVDESRYNTWEMSTKKIIEIIDNYDNITLYVNMGFAEYVKMVYRNNIIIDKIVISKELYNEIVDNVVIVVGMEEINSLKPLKEALRRQEEYYNNDDLISSVLENREEIKIGDYTIRIINIMIELILENVNSKSNKLLAGIMLEKIEDNYKIYNNQEINIIYSYVVILMVVTGNYKSDEDVENYLGKTLANNMIRIKNGIDEEDEIVSNVINILKKNKQLKVVMKMVANDYYENIFISLLKKSIKERMAERVITMSEVLLNIKYYKRKMGEYMLLNMIRQVTGGRIDKEMMIAQYYREKYLGNHLELLRTNVKKQEEYYSAVIMLLKEVKEEKWYEEIKNNGEYMDIIRELRKQKVIVKTRISYERALNKVVEDALKGNVGHRYGDAEVLYYTLSKNKREEINTNMYKKVKDETELASRVAAIISYKYISKEELSKKSAILAKERVEYYIESGNTYTAYWILRLLYEQHTVMERYDSKKEMKLYKAMRKRKKKEDKQWMIEMINKTLKSFNRRT